MKKLIALLLLTAPAYAQDAPQPVKTNRMQPMTAQQEELTNAALGEILAEQFRQNMDLHMRAITAEHARDALKQIDVSKASPPPSQ